VGLDERRLDALLRESATWAGRAAAGTSLDVPLLQTAAALEDVAVAAYTTALGLPLSQSDSTLTALLTTTRAHHAAHAATVNAAVQAAGGSPQDQPDPVVLAQLRSLEPGLASIAGVLSWLARVEAVAAATYASAAAGADTAAVRALAVSVGGVEAQHLAVLRTLSAISTADPEARLGDPPELLALPADAAATGFPDAYASVAGAAPADQAAVP
jgi:hypothetical protein